MIDALKPYPAMKDSGVPWLGAVPEHWAIERAGRLFTKMSRPIRQSDEVITCFRDGTVTLRRNRRVKGFTESVKEIGYQGIRRGDLVIHAMDAFAGAIGVSDSEGKGTPVYSVCEASPSTSAHYFAHVAREMARSQWILTLAKGIRERSTDFRFEDFAAQLVPAPPLAEQELIVRFLNRVDTLIQHYIGTLRRLIGLVAEERDALTRHVTRSEGVSDTRLGLLVHRIFRPVFRHDATIYTPIGLLNRGRGIFHKRPEQGVDLGDSTFFWIKEGDIVVSGQFAWEGAIAIAGSEDAGCIASHRYHIFVPTLT